MCFDPNEMHQLFIVALLKDRIEQAYSLYSTDAVFVTSEGEARGEEAIKAQLCRFAPLAPRMELVERSMTVTADVAQVKLLWRLRGTNIEYAALDVLRRNSEGHWQFLIDNPYGL